MNTTTAFSSHRRSARSTIKLSGTESSFFELPYAITSDTHLADFKILTPEQIKHKRCYDYVTSSLPSYRDIVLNAKKPPSEPQFIITGIPEKEEKYFKQVEEDTKMVDDIIQHMGLRTEGNINAIRRLGKISKTKESDKGENSSSRCRPILVTATNPEIK